jgi:hypothetical protein
LWGLLGTMAKTVKRNRVPVLLTRAQFGRILVFNALNVLSKRGKRDLREDFS